MMDDAEEEALFARLRRGLEGVRRDPGLAQPDGLGAGAADQELVAAVARVEASLRTLASNLESLARRADGLDATVEKRIEATVARNTSGLRAEIERLSARVSALDSPPEAPRLEATRAGAIRPGAGEIARGRHRRRGWLAVLAGLVILALIGFGVARSPLAPRLAAAPFVRTLEGRWAQWWKLLFPSAAAPRAADATVPASRAATENLARITAPPPVTTTDSPPPPPGPTVPAQPRTATIAPAAEIPVLPQTPAAAPVPTPVTPVPVTPVPVAPASVSPVPATLAPPVPVQNAPAAPEQAASSSPPSAASQEPPAPHLQAAALHATSPVWVEVRQRAGQVLLRRTLQAGETWAIPDDPDLLLSTGNAPGLRLVINGQARPLPPSKGGVLRDVPLEAGGT